MQMKENFRNCILYLEDVLNVKSWIMNKYNWKQSKLNTSIVIGLRGEKKQATLKISQLSK